MADFEKTVAINFVTNASKGIKDIEDLRKRIEEIKKQVYDLQKTSGEAMPLVAKTLVERKRSELEQSAMQESGGLGLSKQDQAAIDAQLNEYISLLKMAIPELQQAYVANQQFFGSFRNKSIQEQTEYLRQLNQQLRQTAQTKGINLLDKTQTRALENAAVKDYAQQRLQTVPINATGAYDKTQLAVAKKDIQEYREVVRGQLAQIVAEYKKSQKEIETSQKEQDKNILMGKKELFNAQMTALKAYTSTYLEEQKKQREAERQGLSGSELTTKSKEQADAAIASYKQVQDAYRQQVEERKSLAAQLASGSNNVTQVEVENAKRREEALKIETNQRKQNADAATKEYKRMSDASNDMTRASSSISGLGTIAKYVFGTVLGITAVGAIRNLITYMQQSAQQAITYSKALFTIGLAVKNMQRQGQPTTFSQITQEIKDFRKEFGFFSELELTKSFAEATNKLSNLGYTAEQVSNVVRAGLIVYITDLNGRFNDLGEAINGVTNYLASGYGEALERSGFIAGRAGDKLLAFEKGLGQSLASLDPLTLSQERYNLLMAQTAEKSKDAAEFQTTLAGQYKQAQADITDANVAIGKSVDDITVAWEKAKAAFLSYVAEQLKGENFKQDFSEQIRNIAVAYNKVNKEIERLNIEQGKMKEHGVSDETLASYDKQISKLEETKNKLSELFLEYSNQEKVTKAFPALLTKGQDELLKFAGKDVPDAFKKQMDDLMKAIANPNSGYFLDVAVGISPKIEEETKGKTREELEQMLSDIANSISEVTNPVIKVDPVIDTKKAAYNKAIKDIYDGLYKVQKDYNDRSIELWNDYVNKVGGKLKELDGTVINVDIQGSINLDYQQKVDEIEREFREKTSDDAERLGKIEQDYADKVAEAYRNYSTQLAQAIRQFNIRRAELERNYRLKELQAEREFQLELRKLREGFLMDLEGALRERDALQVIRLSREYNLQKDQMQRQFDEEKRQRKENYEEQQKQLAIEQAERQKQLAEELANRLAAIKQEREAEKAQAQADKEKALADAKAARDQALADAKADYEQRQQELEIETRGRIQEFEQQLKDEGTVTKEFLDQFALDLEGYFGKGQRYDQIMKTFEGLVKGTGENVTSTFEEVAKTLDSLFNLYSTGASKAGKTKNVEHGMVIGGGDQGTGQPGEEPTTAPAIVPFTIDNEAMQEQLQQSLEELQAIRDQALEEEKASDDAMQAEMETAASERIQAFQDALATETSTLQDTLSNFINLLNNYLGPGKTYDIIMTWYEQRTLRAGEYVIQIWMMVAAALKALMTLGKTGEQAVAAAEAAGTNNTPRPNARYSGGAEVYTKPTTLNVSEYEPEFVEITPLSKLSKTKAKEIANNPDTTDQARQLALQKISSYSLSFSGGTTNQMTYKPLSAVVSSSTPQTSVYSPANGEPSKSQIFLQVGLDNGLIAQITDQTLDQAAEIFFDVMRNRL